MALASDYEKPVLGEAVEAELLDFVSCRMEEIPENAF
jgi:hypothetical protein|tara:strand:+ start:280 stop:390 length:111 start_codon:yes stop_codon:yes gene_type:complete